MKRNKIALFSAKGLGDGLLTMILSHNLSLDNEVVVFNSNLSHLAQWFPGKTILPFPSDIENSLKSFDKIIATEHTPLAHLKDLRLQILKESDFDRHQTMVENFVRICREKFLLKNPSKDNGLVIPKDIIKYRYPQRIVFHPTSTEARKNWPKEKFFRLGAQLLKKGWSISLCVPSQEWNLFKECQEYGIALPLFSSLSESAAYIAESGFLIGNDSGMGHLASNIGLPTLSLFDRKSRAKLWRPGWRKGTVITPLPLAVGARLKEATWKQLLTVGKVRRRFENAGLNPVETVG